MAGAGFLVGSVIDFKPERFRLEVLRDSGGEEPGYEVEGFGWGVVVTERSGWATKTRIEPMAICARHGLLVPVNSHWEQVHGFSPEWIVIG